MIFKNPVNTRIEKKDVEQKLKTKVVAKEFLRFFDFSLLNVTSISLE